jgi:hypothetical protein
MVETSGATPDIIKPCADFLTVYLVSQVTSSALSTLLPSCSQVS